MKKEERRLNKTLNSVIKIICAECNNTTKHKVVTSVDIDVEEITENHFDEFYSSSHYQIVECLGCETLSFRYAHTNTEDLDHEGGCYLTEFIYPDRNINIVIEKEIPNLPINIRRIYKETIHCYNNENYTLCGAGLRALVEGLCIENEIIRGEIEYTDKKTGKLVKKNSENLDGKINGLHEKGIITKGNATILHELRFLGNEAIHELSEFNPKHLKLAIDIIENVFDNLYTIPAKAKKMKRSRLSKAEINKEIEKLKIAIAE